jgi:hypothetical protein
MQIEKTKHTMAGYILIISSLVALTARNLHLASSQSTVALCAEGACHDARGVQDEIAQLKKTLCRLNQRAVEQDELNSELQSQINQQQILLTSCCMNYALARPTTTTIPTTTMTPGEFFFFLESVLINRVSLPLIN